MTELARRWNSFTTDDPATRRDLERIGALLCSDKFLKGLGRGADECPIPDDFPVVTDVMRARELLVPEELWDLAEPWPYDEIVGVVEEEAGRMTYCTGISRHRYDEITKFRNDWYRQIEMPLLDHIDAAYEKHGIKRHLRANSVSEQIDDEMFEDTLEAKFKSNIDGFIVYIIWAAFLGGVDNSPVFERMLEGFETGGFPCGWLGPLPEDGGDPVKAVAVFHLG